MDDEQEHDWATRTTALVEQFTSVLRDHSVKPLTGALRTLVAVVIIGLIGIVVLVLVVIGLVRLLDQDVFVGHVWVTDLVIGGIFASVGVFLMQRGVRTRSRHD